MSRSRPQRLALALSVLAVLAASAQTPRFDVASIRPNADATAGAGGAGIRPLPSGQLTAVYVTLEELIRRAYKLHPSQIVGGPAWMTSDRFDIVARSAAPPPRRVEDVLLMLRTLLDERFALVSRTEKRELQAYVLTMTRNGRLGPRIGRSIVDCSANVTPVLPNTAPLDAGGWPPCGLAEVRTSLTTLPEGRRIQTSLKQAAVSMAEFAGRLQNFAGRPIVDASGLTGLFDVQLEFDGQGAGGGPAPGNVPSEAPDLFTALQEQLGLKLESQRTAVDVLVISSASKPAN